MSLLISILITFVVIILILYLVDMLPLDDGPNTSFGSLSSSSESWRCCAISRSSEWGGRSGSEGYAIVSARA